MNKYYTTLLLFIGALTTPIAAANSTETTEEISQDAFTSKKKKTLKPIEWAAIAGGSVVVLFLGWRTERKVRGKDNFIPFMKFEPKKITPGGNESDVSNV